MFTRYIKLKYLNKIHVLQILINVICLIIIAENISVNYKKIDLSNVKRLSNQSAYCNSRQLKEFS